MLKCWVITDFSSQTAGNKTLNFTQHTLYMPYVPCSSQEKKKKLFLEGKPQKTQSLNLKPEG